eukprot:434255-Alexandrium_andersonii.AAC.1
MIRRPPRSTHCTSSAASDVYKRQPQSSSQPRCERLYPIASRARCQTPSEGSSCGPFPPAAPGSTRALRT